MGEARDVTIDLTRRSFLRGLAGVAVIAVLPKVPFAPASPAIAEAVAPTATLTPPPGITYNWVRTALMGEPDMANLEDRLNNGWTFVRPSAHPEMPVENAAIAFERHGLILMQCPTIECALRRTFEQFVSKDKLPARMHKVIFNFGYIVQPSGDIIGTDGLPFTGNIAAEHAAIAATWKQRAAERAS